MSNEIRQQQVIDEINELSLKLAEQATGCSVDIVILTFTNLLIQSLQMHAPHAEEMLGACRSFYVGLFNGTTYDSEQN